MFTGTDIRKLQAIIDKLSDTVSNLQNVVTKLDDISGINVKIRDRVPQLEYKKYFLRAWKDPAGSSVVYYWGNSENAGEYAQINPSSSVTYVGFGDSIGYIISGRVLFMVDEWSDEYSPDTGTIYLLDGADNVIAQTVIDFNNTSGGAQVTHVLAIDLTDVLVTGVMKVKIATGSGLSEVKIYGDSYIVLPLRRP